MASLYRTSRWSTTPSTASTMSGLCRSMSGTVTKPQPRSTRRQAANVTADFAAVRMVDWRRNDARRQRAYRGIERCSVRAVCNLASYRQPRCDFPWTLTSSRRDSRHREVVRRAFTGSSVDLLAEQVDVPSVRRAPRSCRPAAGAGSSHRESSAPAHRGTAPWPACRGSGAPSRPKVRGTYGAGGAGSRRPGWRSWACAYRREPPRNRRSSTESAQWLTSRLMNYPATVEVLTVGARWQQMRQAGAVRPSNS